jgi:hypothetical protein
VDNAGVIQIFGPRNTHTAQDFANVVGGIPAERIINTKADEQVPLIEGSIF